jgi:lipid-A-disaccharide synthase
MGRSVTINKLFIITGDYSGDVHAANVARELWRMQPDMEIAAVGGVNLKSLGVELVCDQSRLGKLGLGSVLSVPEHFLLGRKILKFLDTFQPDAVLLVDYGGFNLWMASLLKKRGCRVFYFIPPQLWASRKGRINKIKAFVDHVFCIFPFEQELYEAQEIPVTYVGHPLVGQLPPPADKNAFCGEFGLDPSRPIVGLLPGSRKTEIDTLLKPMVHSVPAILRERPDAQFVLSQAASLDPDYFLERLNDAMLEFPIDRTPKITVVPNRSHAMLSTSDVVIAASGTVTLEAALYGTPTLIVYKLHPIAHFFYRFGRAFNLIYLPCIGLPNILLDPAHPVVPELMQDAASPGGIAEAVIPLLDRTSSETGRMLFGFEQIRRRLNQGNAPTNVAAGILEMLSGRKRFPVSNNLPLPV